MTPISQTSDHPSRVFKAFDRIPALGLAVIPLAFFVLMIVGLVRWYSPVPFWDMWDAYLAGYIASLDDGWRHLFAQTNEHRIWFANILFYLDLAFFGGRSLFLIPFNVVLVLTIWATLTLIARELLKDSPRLWPAVAILLGPLCFSWLQEQNLSWGFQSQFFVAYLFPLAAFAALAMSADAKHGRGWFIVALIFGLACLGTMANGIAVLPLMVVMSFLMPRPLWRRAGFIFICGGLALFAWFQGYFTVARDHASLSQVATFVLTFFGLPVGEMLGSETASYAAGAFFIVAAAYFAIFWLRSRGTTSPLVLGLVMFLAYVGASCAVTALGRAAIQPNAALVSRYATPSLIAWCALAILFAYAFRHQRAARTGAIVIGVMAAVGLWSAQRQVFKDVGPELVHQRLAGALALKMRVADRQVIGAIYPTAADEAFNHVRTVADMAEKKNLSIMADPILANAVAQIGRPVSEGFHICAGALDVAETIEGETAYRRASGWVFDQPRGAVPSFAYLVVNDVIEGVVATGHVRRDVIGLLGHEGLKSGFTGFLRAAAADASPRIYCAS